MWDRTTGQPLYNAVVWSDTRTKDVVHRLSESSDKGSDAVKVNNILCNKLDVVFVPFLCSVFLISYCSIVTTWLGYLWSASYDLL